MRNLQGVVSFVEAAAHGSFTAAAQRLALTPAAVSKNVQRLEQQLQVRLFNRTTRRLTLTAEGTAFADSARQALRALDDAVSGVSRAGGEAVGRVRISVGMAFGRRHVLPALPALAAAHPALELELSLDNRPVDLVAEGFDIGIRGGFIRDSSLVARRVCRLPVVLVASPAYLAAQGVPAAPGDLATHQLLGVRLATGAPSAWRFRTPAGKLASVEPAARLWASDPEAMVDLALLGAGICQTGLHHVVPLLNDGRLKVVLADHHDADEREIVLHYPHRQFLSTRVRVVVDALLLHFAAQPALHLRPQDLPSAWRAETAAEATRPGGGGTPAAAASTPPRRKRSPRR
jgi:DNA-binding transcriptional LysR family regulator